MIRYFCVVTGTDGDRSREYLTALAATDRPVRAIPIGPAFPPAWGPLGRLFGTDLRYRFVNVVAAPPGFLMGSRLVSRDMEPGTGVDLEAIDSASIGRALVELAHVKVPGKGKEYVYEPQTALAGLYTVGCNNIAIVTSLHLPLDHKEVRALRRYGAVVVTGPEDKTYLDALGIDCIVVPPLPSELSLLLDRICGPFSGSGTTATSPSRRATPEPPTTTSSPSPGTPTSRSRSLNLALRAASSNPGIACSSPSSGSWLTRTWRSITRRLRRWLS